MTAREKIIINSVNPGLMIFSSPQYVLPARITLFPSLDKTLRSFCTVLSSKVRRSPFQRHPFQFFVKPFSLSPANSQSLFQGPGSHFVFIQRTYHSVQNFLTFCIMYFKCRTIYVQELNCDCTLPDWAPRSSPVTAAPSTRHSISWEKPKTALWCSRNSCHTARSLFVLPLEEFSV